MPASATAPPATLWSQAGRGQASHHCDVVRRMAVAAPRAAVHSEAPIGTNGPMQVEDWGFHGGMRQWDVISVGDTATDVFIRLLEGRVKTVEDESGRWLMFPYGDKLPFDHAQTVESGGNAANAAVAFSRLGLATTFATHVGDDQVGRDIQLALRREGVDTHLLRVDPGVPSNRNFVLWFGEDRTILVRHQIYDYHWTHLRPSEIPRWLYLSSVGSDAPQYYDQLSEWLEAEPSVRFAFQPGTFQIATGVARARGPLPPSRPPRVQSRRGRGDRWWRYS